MLGIKTRFVCACLGLIGAALFAGASPQPSSAVQDSDSEILVYKLDPVHCMANFRIQHMRAGMFWGRFNMLTGTMSSSESGERAPEFDITVAVDSVDTGTEKLDRTLMGPNFFDAKEFDSITFKSTEAVPNGEKKWTVTGDLTLLGVTKTVTAEVELTGMNGNPVMKKIGYEAVLSIKRSEFGMDWGVKNGALGDEVKLIVAVEGDWSA